MKIPTQQRQMAHQIQPLFKIIVDQIVAYSHRPGAGRIGLERHSGSLAQKYGPGFIGHKDAACGQCQAASTDRNQPRQ